MEMERNADQIASRDAFAQSLRPGRWRPMDPYQAPKFVHRVPRSKIRIDGEVQPGAKMRTLDGQPLIYIHNRDDYGNEELCVFTSLDQAIDATGFKSWSPDDAEVAVAAEQSSTSGQRVSLGGYVDLFEHADYRGAVWGFYPRWGPIPDFRHVYGWSNFNINDRVSSMDVNVNANPPGTVAWVILYSDIDFEGEQLWTSNSYAYDDYGGGMRRNLENAEEDYYWNDTVSSLAYGYTVTAT